MFIHVQPHICGLKLILTWDKLHWGESNSIFLKYIINNKPSHQPSRSNLSHSSLFKSLDVAITHTYHLMAVRFVLNVLKVGVFCDNATQMAVLSLLPYTDQPAVTDGGDGAEHRVGDAAKPAQVCKLLRHSKWLLLFILLSTHLSCCSLFNASSFSFLIVLSPLFITTCKKIKVLLWLQLHFSFSVMVRI